VNTNGMHVPNVKPRLRDLFFAFIILLVKSCMLPKVVGREVHALLKKVLLKSVVIFTKLK
jgi:hypothetical protein